MTTRRFPRPWTVEETYTCFTVLDANGQKLAYVYFENAPGRRDVAKLLTYDEARRIAANTAKLCRNCGVADRLQYRRRSHINVAHMPHTGKT